MQRTATQHLIEWKQDPTRPPLIIRGARQVGKSWIIQDFGQQHFQKFIEINFEFEPDAKSIFQTLDPQQIIEQIEIWSNQTIDPEHTLIFLDEIQECPKALLALRYFKEKSPQHRVIAAGSLLEFTLEDERFRFPVGRVEFLQLGPLSFYEFLEACEEHLVLKKLQQSINLEPLPEAIHNKCLKLLEKYLIIGGMPAVVGNYLKNMKTLDCLRIQNSLLEGYRRDFGKYSTKSQHRHIQHSFAAAPRLVGEQVKYSKLNPEVRSRETKEAILRLSQAGLINVVYATPADGLPLGAIVNEKKFKLTFLDVGLMQNVCHLDPHHLSQGDIMKHLGGALAEQFAGQELLSLNSPYSSKELFYWARDKSGSEAEVDYLYQHGENIIPVEIKAGTTGQLKSLQLFLKEKNCPFGIKCSQHPLSFDGTVLSIPLYMMGSLPMIVAQTLNSAKKS